MENNYKDMFNFLNENDLGISSLNLDIIKHMDLNNKEIVIKKVNEISDRYKNANNKYSESIMQQLRQRIGLEDKYDISEDEYINNMSKDDVFSNLLSWNGLIGWDCTIKEWIKEIYNIEL